MKPIRDVSQGDHETFDHWRFESIPTGAEEFRKYGWRARVGNFGLKADLHPMRFQIRNTTGLSRVFPYINIPTTIGIKEIPNPAYINAPIEAGFIWNRKAITMLGRDTTSLNPMMPFAMRDFGGKWQFAMDNLTCGTAVAKDSAGNNITVPIAVGNERRNKGKFLADFAFATKCEYPELLEVFLYRTNRCVVGDAPCGDPPAYVFQDFDSSNTPCS